MWLNPGETIVLCHGDVYKCPIKQKNGKHTSHVFRVLGMRVSDLGYKSSRTGLGGCGFKGKKSKALSAKPNLKRQGGRHQLPHARPGAYRELAKIRRVPRLNVFIKVDFKRLPNELGKDIRPVPLLHEL